MEKLSINSAGVISLWLKGHEMSILVWNMSNLLNLWSYQGLICFNTLSRTLIWWSLKAIVYTTLCVRHFLLFKGLKASFYLITHNSPVKVSIAGEQELLNPEWTSRSPSEFKMLCWPYLPRVWLHRTFAYAVSFRAWPPDFGLINLLLFCRMLDPPVHHSLTSGICPLNKLVNIIINSPLNIYFLFLIVITSVCLP